MSAKTKQLRALLASGEFLYMPSATTPIEGKLAEAAGAKLVYTGGYATGATRAITEPLLTMDEQVRVAGEVERAVAVPLVADAGAGFGEPLHTMRTVREFAAAGVAGIHIEDQLFPKRAHYHNTSHMRCRCPSLSTRFAGHAANATGSTGISWSSRVPT